MKHFSIKELSSSPRAKAEGIDNTPGMIERENLTALVDNILDPLREAYGKPITVTSGYRCSRLNRSVGGVKGSHHLRGMAADIVGTPPTREENRRLFDLARAKGLPYCQLIHEKGTVEEGPDWVHVSYNAADKRRQIVYVK